LISALAKFPAYTCIGIDEGTAIIVDKKKITVTGISQVIVMKHPERLKITDKGLIKFSNVHEGIYTNGDVIDMR